MSKKLTGKQEQEVPGGEILTQEVRVMFNYYTSFTVLHGYRGRGTNTKWRMRAGI